MRTASIAVLALSLTAANAFAQSTTGTSSTGTTSPGSSIGRGAPALSPKSSGPATPNRSNTEVFPPSRLLPPTGGSVSTQQTQTPGSTSTGTTSATGAATTGQSATQGGISTTPGDASTATSNTSTSGTQTNGNATATTSDGQSNTSGSTGPIKPIPPNSQTSSGAGSGQGSGQPFATRTGKNALNETVTDCMKIWDPATHMSKADWQRTCRRVQGRLDQVTKDVLQK
jgi:hypothetical protein